MKGVVVVSVQEKNIPDFPNLCPYFPGYGQLHTFEEENENTEGICTVSSITGKV